MNKTETLPVYDSSQRGLPALEELTELIRYRNLVFQTVRRNIVVRYKRSVLGIAWTMLNPLGTALILTFVFSGVFGGESSYAVYVLSGLVCWTFFSQATNDAMHQLIWGGGLLKRIYIPRTVFAVSSVITGLVNMALAMVPLLFIMLATGGVPQWSMLIMPVPALFLAMFALGVGLMLSAIAIYFVDVTEMYTILLMAWFYLSPVIYKKDFLPEEYAWIVQLNPMYYLINLFRAPIYEGRIPSLQEFLVAGGIAVVTLLVGWFIFAQKADEFAYRV